MDCDALWLVTDAQQTCSRVAAALDETLSTRSVRLLTTATANTPDADTELAAAMQDPTLCAAVVAVEANGLANAAYRRILEWCIVETGRRRDFRLFIHAEESLLPIDGILTGDVDQLLRILIDTVEHADGLSLTELARRLAGYLDDVREIRLERSSSLTLATVLIAFCLGSEARQVVATAFQLRRPDALSAYHVHFATALGWALLLAVWIGRLAAEPLACAVAACAGGWFGTDAMFSRIAELDRTFLRDGA